MRSNDIFLAIRECDTRALYSSPAFLANHLDILCEDGHTPLSLAIQLHANECAQILLDHGANPRCCDAWGNAPIVIAAAQQNYRVVQLLLSLGVDCLELDERGSSLTTIAAAFHDVNLKRIDRHHRI